jgi:hypothetical protein
LCCRVGGSHIRAGDRAGSHKDFSARDAKYEIDGLNVSFTGGEVVTGKLNFFVRLIEVAVDRYCEWLKLLAAQQA